MTDEMKPVRCGCGGEAKVECANGYDPFAEKIKPNLWYGVICKKCKIQTKAYYTEAEAVTAWNRSMGNRMELQTVERTAKVVNQRKLSGEITIIIGDTDVGECGNCGKPVLKSMDRYCHECGARLEWK